MTLSNWEMETIKNEMAEVREFYRQRLDADLPPLQEEIKRLSQAVGEITERRREAERQQVLAHYNGGAGSSERPVVSFGKYQGMDALDLACVRSVLAAQQREPGDADSRALEAWQANLKAAMDSATAGRGDELVAHGGSSHVVGRRQSGHARSGPVPASGHAHQPVPDPATAGRRVLVSGRRKTPPPLIRRCPRPAKRLPHTSWWPKCPGR